MKKITSDRALLSINRILPRFFARPTQYRLQYLIRLAEIVQADPKVLDRVKEGVSRSCDRAAEFWRRVG